MPNIGKKKVRNMIARFFPAHAEKENAYRLYGAIVAQARSSAFYTQMDVEDTLEGRFDMILLHVFLADYRLEQAGSAYVRLRRYIQEAMVSDMDRSLRELGVGDMSVGKEMKKVGAALLGRKAAYTAALKKDASSQALQEALSKNIYRDKEVAGVAALEAYVRGCVESLESQELSAPKNCSLTFPQLS